MVRRGRGRCRLKKGNDVQTVSKPGMVAAVRPGPRGLSSFMPYCASIFSPRRRLSRVVHVGKVAIGGEHPIRIQSMLTCDTMDTAACIRQTLELVAVGCEIVRITAPTVKDAANLQHIKRGLFECGCDVPLVA